MIRNFIEEAFTPEQVIDSIVDQANPLVILRKIIPWETVVNGLTPFYSDTEGRPGIPVRTAAALLIIQKFRGLSDRETVDQVRENRYIQYFCNVPNSSLPTFIHHSSLSRIRSRLGEKGAAVIESAVFAVLRESGVINGDCILADSTVLPGNIAYPTDIALICSAFEKMRLYAEDHGISLQQNEKEMKELRREYNMNKDKSKTAEYLFEFVMIFSDTIRIFEEYAADFAGSEREKEEVGELLTLMRLLNEQNGQKIAGEKHIENRIVSVSDPDMRPIKKGKSHPDCEFGTTVQVSFNRDGFMTGIENFIGNPGDAKIFGGAFDLFVERMKVIPGTVVTDSGYRSRSNIENLPPETVNIFMGRSSDVTVEKRDFCKSARAATEGFIAVAKNLRGFGRSLYRGLKGHRIWSLLCQTAYNLKKFLQFYFADKIKEESLIKLGLA